MKRTIISGIAALLLLASCADNITEQTNVTETETTTQAETSATETTSADTESVEASGKIPNIPVPDLSEYNVTDPFSYEAGIPEITGDLETIKEVNFFRDGKKICGKLYLPEGEGPFPVVVISSGQTASYTIYEDEAKSFAENGCACIIFDFTGAVGRKLSDGELTESSVLTEVQDLNAVLDSLSYLPKTDTENVFLWGHSLGGLVSAYTGGNRPDDIKGLILLEPSFTYPDYARYNSPDLSQVADVITDPKMYNTMVGKQFVIDMCSVDVMKEIGKCDKDVLIILGDADEKTSASPALGYLYPEIYETAEKTFSSAETVVINGADHIFQGEYGKESVRKSVEFIRNVVQTQECSYVCFGSYEQDNDTSNGKEPVEWRILAKEGDKALLISRYGLDDMAYAANLNDGLWDKCSLREWLNEEFINTAFSQEEQKSILSSAVTADMNPDYSTFPGEDTTDKVFLLSVSDVDKYFGTYGERRCEPTVYCLAQGTVINKSNGYCWWWLRTPGDSSKYAVVVEDDGSFEPGGDRVTLGGQAVRPAMWIDLSLADLI